MNAIFLRRRRKVMLKPGSGHQTELVLAAMQKNLESLGFVMSPLLMDRVRTLTDEKLATFYKSLVSDLQSMVGAQRTFAPMYPNFPDQVEEMPEWRLYLNAITHYITNRLPVFAQDERQALTEKTELRVIELGERETFEQIFSQLAGARTSLSPQDKQDVVWFVSQYGTDIRRLMPVTLPSKENLAVVGGALMQFDSKLALEVMSRHIKTATDVLRLAVAMSDGDVSLAQPVRFRNFKRAVRRALLSWIDRTGHPLEDMQRWAARWIRLGEKLHPGDHAEVYPAAYGAFKALRNGERLATFNTKIEDLLARRESDSALSLLRTRPGELGRRLDHLLRTSPGSGAVLNAFRDRAQDVSTAVLLQIHSHFSQRRSMPEYRVFFPKGETAKAFAKVNELPPVSDEACAAVISTCEVALMDRFRKLPALNSCWVDPRMAQFMVPLAQRSASKSLRTLTRGSRLPLPDSKVLRFFIWWKDGATRTDIDLSAALFDREYHCTSVLAFYNLKDIGGVHSGDVVSAPKGASEFIDLNVGQLRQKGVRYILMMINSYTQQPYCDLPECFAGWMARQEAGSGEIYEPRTVVDKLDVASNTQICIPAVFDIEASEVIWADLALTARPRFNNHLDANLASASLMIRALTTLAKPNLHTLFTLHARARGSLVNDRAGATTVFALDEGVTPYHLDLIRSEYL